jgi:hypothetical protein
MLWQNRLADGATGTCHDSQTSQVTSTSRLRRCELTAKLRESQYQAGSYEIKLCLQ